MPTETNALQARLRMEISRQNWQKAKMTKMEAIVFFIDL
jgi:hypothetical protein